MYVYYRVWRRLLLISHCRGMVNFVVGFSGNHVNPNLVMADLRAALIEIFTSGGSPWDTIVRNFTANATTLSHTPVIYIEMGEEGQAWGRQIVLSIPPVRPWGFLPVCHNPTCDASVGDVKGRAYRRHGWAGYHGNFRLKCKVCLFTCSVSRPHWIQHIGAETGFNFWMPWPLTEQQRNAALGLDQTWVYKVQETSGASGGEGAGDGTAGSKTNLQSRVQTQNGASGAPMAQVKKNKPRKKRNRGPK